MMEWVKSLISEYIEEGKQEEFIEKFNKEFPLNAVPKKKYNETAEKLNAANEDLKEYKGKIETFQGKIKEGEDLETKLTELKEELTKVEEKSNERVKNILRTSSLKEALFKKNAHKDAVDLLARTYADKLEVDGDEVKGLDELIGTITEERKGLFLQEEKNSKSKGEHKDSGAEVDDLDQVRKIFGLEK